MGVIKSASLNNASSYTVNAESLGKTVLFFKILQPTRCAPKITDPYI